MLIEGIKYPRPSYPFGFARYDWEAPSSLWEGQVGVWAPALGITGDGLKSSIPFINTDDGTFNGFDPIEANSGWKITEHGYAIELDGFVGTSGDYIPITDSGILGKYTYPARGWSVAAWVNTDTTGDVRVIMSKWDFSASREWLLQKQADDTFLFELRDNDADNLEIESVTTAVAGTWYFVVGTWDGGLDGTAIKIYVNGISEGTGSESGTFSGVRTSTSQQVLIGNQFTSGIAAIDRSWNGKFLYTGLWERALNANEVFLLSRNPLAQFQLKQPVWKAPAAVGGLSIPVASHGYRRRFLNVGV